MKRFILILLAAVIGLMMFACGKESSDIESFSPPEKIDSELKTLNDAIGGSENRELIFQYVDKCVGFNFDFVDYIEEKVGMNIDTWEKNILKTTEDVTNCSIFIAVSTLGIPKDDFIRLNNSAIEKISKIDGFPSKELYDDNYCFTDEEIEIIYSGDKKRIAEAFANPYAVIADDWEIYPLRWIIDNPATLYKEKQISLKALETAAHKLIDQGESQISDEDSAALLARIAEYKKLQ